MLEKGSVALVTGGAGFIGSHLVDALVDKGLKIRVLDDLSSGKLENLAHTSRSNQLSVIRNDVMNVGSVRRAVRGTDVVFHLAAKVDVQESLADPINVNRVNVEGTLSILEACRKFDVPRVVYASSSAIYADSSRPISENATVGPISPYGASKLAGEAYVQQFHRTYGMATTCLRFFNVYGPRQVMNAYSGVITIFAHRLLHAKPLIIYGSGKQTRDFIHVSEIVRANLLAADCKRASGEIFNVGTGTATSVLALAHTMSQIAGAGMIVPLFSAARKGDILHNCANIQKIRRALGFKASVSMKAGLRDLLNSYQSTFHPQHN